MAINSLARYPLLSLLLPIFMSRELGYNYMMIGGMFMAYSIILSLIVFVTMRISLSFIRVIMQSVVYLVACIFLSSTSEVLLPFFIILLAFASGLETRFYESIIAMVSKNRRETLSEDIGILHIPMRILEFTSLILFSIIAEEYSYHLPFILSGITYLIILDNFIYASC